MAGPDDFFSPGEWPGQVQETLENPRIRAGLTQFGLNMLGGGGWGGSFGQDLARGIGGAGEAIGRQEKMDTVQDELGIKQGELGVRQQEADSRGEARLAQAESAAMRGQVAQQNANTAEERARIAAERNLIVQEQGQARLDQVERRIQGSLAIAQQKLDQATTTEERRAAQAEKDRIIREGRLEQDRIRTETATRTAGDRREQNTMSNRIRLQGLHQEALKAEDANWNNNPRNMTKPRPPKKSFGDWLDESGYEGQFPEVPRTPKAADTQGGVPGTTPPPAAGTSTPPASTGKPPEAPRNPADRKMQNYTTPRGVLYWDGKAWQPEKK